MPLKATKHRGRIDNMSCSATWPAFTGFEADDDFLYLGTGIIAQAGIWIVSFFPRCAILGPPFVKLA